MFARKERGASVTDFRDTFEADMVVAALTRAQDGFVRVRELEAGDVVAVVPLMGLRGRITRGPDREVVEAFW